MSYSFSLTAPTKDAAKALVAEKMASVVAQQPAHKVDQEAAVNAANTFIDVLHDPEEGQEISLDRASPGDLVFFHIRGGKHVTIYIGDNRVVHAPSKGKDVRVVSVDVPYWRERLWKVVRILD